MQPHRNSRWILNEQNDKLNDCCSTDDILFKNLFKLDWFGLHLIGQELTHKENFQSTTPYYTEKQEPVRYSSSVAGKWTTRRFSLSALLFWPQFPHIISHTV